MKLSVRSPQKLVAFLQGHLGNYSGKAIRRLLEANLCRINGRVERFGSKEVQRGDAVELASHWKSALQVPVSKIEILYENEAFKIINKPADWVCTDIQARRSLGPHHYLVHRLDKDTTGLLIVAKSLVARDALMELFEQRAVQKHYLALVDGIPSENEGVRRSLLEKRGAYQGQTIWGSGQKGLTAVTHWKKWAVGRQAALLLCEPVTGRTHQIRVHLSEMGHPILVDRQYAKTFRCSLFIQRPLLHAYRLQFVFQGEEIDVRAPLFIDICEALRGCGIEMGQLRELFAKEEHQNRRDQRHGDEEAKEVEEASHPVHESRQ